MNIEQAQDQAIALHQQGRLVEAERIYTQILAQDSANLAARHMLGVIRAQQRRNDEACELIAFVVRTNPNDALALSNYANVLNALGRFESGLNHLDKAVKLAPNYADAWNNRGNSLQNLWRLEEALASYDKALSLQPIFPLALVNRGNLRRKQRDLTGALHDYERAIAQAPNYAEAHKNRGDVLQMLCRYREALPAYDTAVGLDPHCGDFWNNRATALLNLNNPQEAMENYRRAAAIMPLKAEPNLNLGLCHLLLEEFEPGWRLFEWRKQLPGMKEAREYQKPLWTGTEAIQGRTLLAYIEVGLGDAIHFYRYAPLAQELGATVVLEVHDCLLRLFEGATPPVKLIGRGHNQDFDYHIPLMSLPLALARKDIPSFQRYLAAERERVRQWSERLGKSGFRVAIAWQGNTNALGSEGKSFPLSALAPIANIPGVRLISVQKNSGSEQLNELPSGMKIESFDHFDEDGDAFIDSAAILKNVDLVISCDTAIAHLAGALGVPTWLALKYVPEWRWFLDRADSPWYPSTRLFRQTEPGHWDGVFRKMGDALSALLSCRHQAKVPGGGETTDEEIISALQCRWLEPR